jgi:putative transcriptional regulator
MKNILRELRAEQGWSQGDLAERLDVARQSVNAIETGKYDPSLPLAFRIARLFGKRIEEIFDDLSPPPAAPLPPD